MSNQLFIKQTEADHNVEKGPWIKVVKVCLEPKYFDSVTECASQCERICCELIISEVSLLARIFTKRIRETATWFDVGEPFCGGIAITGPVKRRLDRWVCVGGGTCSGPDGEQNALLEGNF